MTPTLNLQENWPANADFYSTPWEVKPTYVGRALRGGSLQIIWSGLDALSATVELEVSNTNEDDSWSCYGGVDILKLDTNPDNQVFEFSRFNTRYIRLHYKHGTVSAGMVKIRTHGEPLYNGM